MLRFFKLRSIQIGNGVRVCSTTTQVKLKPEESTGLPFLNKIIKELAKKNVQFILPVHDTIAINKIVEPFDELRKIGVLPEFVLDTCLTDPSFLKLMARDGAKVVKILDVVSQVTAMTFENAIRLFCAYKDDLMAVEVKCIEERIQVYINNGISEGEELRKVVCKCPVILFANDPPKMAVLAESLINFFTRGQVKAILANSPQILLSNFEEIEEKYEYIYFHMRIESEEFRLCKSWVDKSIDDIMKRHKFLLQTGKYVTPDPKRLQLQKENAPLYRILDSNDTIFATQIAGVVPEEWIVYSDLFDKQKASQNKDRAFERVKPSVRKAFERRLKHAPARQDFIL
uniref:Uncharacterized protein n=1 Tax=Rhabditophanes sp. KR3021 TaxID=114890 RepID=A0AC35UF89_9BILA